MSISDFKNYVVIICTVSLLHFIFPVVVLAQNLNISPAKKNNHPRISSYLLNLAHKYKENVEAPQVVARGLDISSRDSDKVKVYLMSEPGTSIDEDALDNLGAQIIKRAENVTKAKVPINMLTAVADNVDGISFMKTPDKLIPVAVTSQGVDLTGADNFHVTGYDGSGVKIAVFDVGFIGLSDAITNNELPTNVVKVDCRFQPCNSNYPSIENTSNHGTAVAEIIHDMAPGAMLYLIEVSDTMDLEDAKDFAVNNGIRIINHSLVVLNSNFYDGKCWSLNGFSNPVCTADNAYVNNILWVNAAGNEAQKHYEAVFTDSDADGWHNVSGSSEIISISANAGDTIEVYLTWNAWPTTNQDYDLYLYNAFDTLVDSSSNSQTGSQPPIEKIVYSVPVNGTYYIRIRQHSATTNHSMEVYSLYHNLSPAVVSSSLLGPADAAGAMAVGAINYSNWATGPQEPFSSRGPTNDGRIKPDIMGPDHVSNSIFGIFTGTSASCAHVSGAAALILNKNPGISVDQIWNSLTSAAIYTEYMNDPNIYGAGLLDLDINEPIDNCPNDPNKTEPGICGCGTADIDSDSDGTFDCNDNCPNDPNKIAPGICGCGVTDSDTDLDGTPNCIDNCLNDPNKTGPGICGCGIADIDSDGDRIPDCNDDCNNLIDSDGDGTNDCNDRCPADPNKTQPGICGCGISDMDSDMDGTLDCHDANDDNDGLSDGEEQGPNGNNQNYDGNNDGTPDSLQENVASFHTYDGLNYVTMESPAGTSISNCNAVGNPSPTNTPSNVEFFYGFFGFRIENVGSTTSVTLYLPVGETIDTYYRYGPTPNNTVNHWYKFLYDGQTGAEINGNKITLHFVDGMRGDDDLTANGILVDVGAPAVTIKSSGGGTTVASDGGGGGGCFIATAAYGSLMEPHVKILREFRDRFMLGNAVGDSLIRYYYTYSPPIANFIAKHDSLKAIVRISLLPIVGISWVALKFGSIYSLILMLILAINTIGMVGIRRRYKRQTI